MKTHCISLAVFCLCAILNPAIARQVEWLAGTDLLYTNPATARVAVGNAEASAALDVKGGIVVRNNVTPRGTVKGNERLRMTGSTSDYIVAVQDGTGRVQHYWNASTGTNSTYLVNGEPAGKLVFSPTGELFSVRYAPVGTAGAPITWRNYFRIKNDGKVGIGVSNPGAKLDVNGDVWVGTLATRTGKLLLNGRGWGMDFRIDTDNDSVDRYVFYGNGEEVLRINDTGEVGVGTSAPDEKLTVKGRVKAQEVIVTQDAWPDYVFDDGYALLPLEELARYVTTHRRLPDIPSQAEVQQQGVALGDFQARLLQKVEELTLYVIAQHKRIRQLENALRGDTEGHGEAERLYTP